MMKRMNIRTVLILSVALLFGMSSCHSILKSRGLHPDYDGKVYDLKGKKALVVTTSHGTLNKPGETGGDSTGVFSSEMTIPYYEFLDANMEVHVASIKGGQIPIDPKSFKRAIRAPEDDRFLEDDILQEKVSKSIPVATVDFSDYDVVFFAGGWGAAYDMGQSEVVAQKVSEGYYNSDVIYGSVCHGALAFIAAKDKDGGLLIKGRTMTGVTQSQLDQLNVAFTPLHPEEELKKAGADFKCSTGKRDFFETLTVADAEKRFITGQNQNSGHETSQLILETIASKSK